MEKVRILAFDPGTANCGWSLTIGDMETKTLRLSNFKGLFETSKEDGDIRKRADIIGEWMVDLIDLVTPTHITIEDYTEQGVRSGKTYKDMSILIENMRLTCRMKGFEARIRTNAEWKKLATGHAGLNKNQVMHFVRHKVQGTEILGSRGKDVHIWDTVGIAYAEFISLQGEK
jgi:Holliday junction resolvasome RuvABC endonuclease subunit